jgi:hypothetical protein
MLWWVSSSALVITLLGAIWLKIDEVKDASPSQRGVLYLLVGAFILSLVLYGSHVMRSACLLEYDVRSLNPTVEAGVSDHLLCRLLTWEHERVGDDVQAPSPSQCGEVEAEITSLNFEVEFRIVRLGTAIGTSTFALALAAWISVVVAIELEKKKNRRRSKAGDDRRPFEETCTKLADRSIGPPKEPDVP